MNNTNILEQLSAYTTIADFSFKYIIVPLISGVLGAVGWEKAKENFRKKKENRLLSNVARPVALIPTKDDPLEVEERLLNSIDFFSIDLFPPDARSLDDLTSSYRLAIVRYEDSKTFWHIFQTLAHKQVPMIIYCNPGEIPLPNVTRIHKSYTRYTICNTPVRLASDVFAIMSVYPEGK